MAPQPSCFKSLVAPRVRGQDIMDELLRLCLVFSILNPISAHVIWPAAALGNKYNQIVSKESALCYVTPPPQILAYHIHVLFWGANETSTQGALGFREHFNIHFNITESCKFGASQPQPRRNEICKWDEIDKRPVGPFPIGQYSWWIPRTRFYDTVPWVSQNRRNFDVFVHPMTGCENMDHLHGALWSGHEWPLDVSCMSCHYPGCSSPPEADGIMQV